MRMKNVDKDSVNTTISLIRKKYIPEEGSCIEITHRAYCCVGEPHNLGVDVIYYYK